MFGVLVVTSDMIYTEISDYLEILQIYYTEHGIASTMILSVISYHITG